MGSRPDWAKKKEKKKKKKKTKNLSQRMWLKTYKTSAQGAEKNGSQI